MATETIYFISGDGESELTYAWVIDTDLSPYSNNFQPGQEVYFKLYPGGENPTLRATSGTIEMVSSGVGEVVEERLTFARSDRQSLRYPVNEIQTVEWEGRPPTDPNWRLEGDYVVLNQPGSGILKVQYLTVFDRIKLMVDSEVRVLVEAWTVSRYGYTTVDYLPEERDVTITVRDACTRGAIPSAMVYVDGELKGATDSNGRISLGKLRKGRHHISVVKAGYASTDSDGIANSYFEVVD